MKLNMKLKMKPAAPTTNHPQRQKGIVLIVALIMLIIISLLAALSVHNATSSEGVSSNVRQTQSANQVTDAALRYCEAALESWASGSTATFNFSTGASSTTVTFGAAYVQDLPAGTATLTSMTASNWDGTTNAGVILVVPSSSSFVNSTLTMPNFNRAPECMFERLAASTDPAYSQSFAVTAHGFGPEVAAADTQRTRPVGSEVFLQSTLQFY